MYRPRTKPFSHQQEWWEKTREQPVWAVLWEQGTGKTKTLIDTAGWLFTEGRISCLFVIAPNGVHRNWVVDEVPTHLGEDVPRTLLLWHSSKAGNQSFIRERDEALEAPGLLIVAMSYDGLMTDAGNKFATELVKRRKTMMVLDESVRIKNPKALRTRRVLGYTKSVAYRRILTGTPVTNSPFDVFAPFKFLDPEIWNRLGCRTWSAFKTFFGEWRESMDPKSGRFYKELVRYRNLDRLSETIGRVSCRVTKAEVLDLPPKIYTKRYFTLSPAQARAYKKMRDAYELMLDSGEVSTAPLVIVQLLRFQQIVSNFVVTEDREALSLGEDNPRLALLKEVIEDTEGKILVFAKFTYDINLIMRLMADMGIEAVRYDGQTKEADRADAVQRFQKGSARVLVGNPSTIKEGLTLHAANTVVYYNNSYKLEERLQSEDRPHRIGQTKPVLYIDLVAEKTIDERITKALREKLNVASIITGDKLKEWI